MDELDEVLGRLAHAPVHPALAAGEAELLACASARAATTPRLGGRGIVLAAAVATVMGIAGAVVPAANAEPQSPLSPFSAAVTLAPSTLLGSDR